MKTLLITDARLFAEKNVIYADYPFACILNRYKKYFGEITVFAKAGEWDKKPKSAVKIQGFNIHLCGNNRDFYFGKNKELLKKVIPQYDMLILRVPSVLAYQAARTALAEKIPYLCEVVGCAWDGLWNHSWKGKIIAPFMFIKMKRVVKYANYATYVTSAFLQHRYPTHVRTIAASNVEIVAEDNETLEKRLMSIEQQNLLSEVKLMTAAAVNVLYKGQQYVIRAIPRINKMGIRVKYYVVGTGDNTYLKTVADKLGVADQVIFTGALPHDELLSKMDDIDIYIQPSLQEGLPRSVIEAMSRACPCAGAKTAGIPELLDPEFISRRKSHVDIANIIKKYCTMSNDERSNVARRNFEEAKKYNSVMLNDRRESYYKFILREITNDNID